MLKRARDVSVLHVAGTKDDEALETLCRTSEVISSLGVDQLLLALDDGRGADVIWTAALPLKVRPLRFARPSIFAKIRALQSEFAALSRERFLYAVHLHGLQSCLLGSRALKGSPLQGRVLYSPHLSHSASRWTLALLRPLLQSHLQPHDCAAVTASLTEAQTLSKLLNRSAEVLPHPVSATYFEVVRHEVPRPSVLVDGFGAEAVNAVTRLSVLLNGREARVPLSWLGPADARARAQLDAAGVQVLDIADQVERARALSRAWACIHVTPARRLPHGVAQAMAAGVPSLVSDTPPHRALIRHGETGFVCTSDRDLLEKLIVLLRHPAERQRIGEAARADAERRFTSRHFETAILRAYGFSTGDNAPAQRAQQMAANGERKAWNPSVN